GAVGQREAPVEAAVAALDARVALGVLAGFALALAADGKDALVHRHFDILRIHARKVGVDHEAGGLLLDVDPRLPLRGDHRGVVGVLREERGVEQTVERLAEFALERIAPEQGRPVAVTGVADDAHGVSCLSLGAAPEARRRCRVDGRGYRGFKPLDAGLPRPHYTSI